MSELELLREVDLLWGMNEEELRLFLNIATRQPYPKGTMIFSEGDPCDYLYIVASGIIEIFTDIGDGAVQSLGELTRGTAFGDMALINDKPRSANARSIEDSELLCVLRDDFLDLIDNYPIFSVKALINLSRTLSNRLRSTTQILREAMTWNLKIGGASALHLGSLIDEAAKVRIRLLGGEEFKGTLLKVEQGIAGYEITVEDEANQMYIFPYHALVYIHVETTITTAPMHWQ